MSADMIAARAAHDKEETAKRVQEVRNRNLAEMAKQQERAKKEMTFQQLVIVAFQMALDEDGVSKFNPNLASDCISAAELMMRALQEHEEKMRPQDDI